MPAVTYEIGANNSKLRATLAQSKSEVAALRASVQKEAASLQKSGGLFGDLKGALGALGGAAALKNIADGIGELVDTSDQLDIPAEKLDRLSKAMQGSGISSENIRKSLLNLNTVRQAALKGDEAARAKLEALGISMAQLGSSDLLGTFMDVADGLSHTEDASVRASLAMDALGLRQAKMIAAMKGGSDALKAQMAAVNGITDAEAHQIDDAADDAVAKIESAKTTLAQGLVAAANAAGYVAANVALAGERFMNGENAGALTPAQSDSLDAKYAGKESASQEGPSAEQKLADAAHQKKMLQIAQEHSAAQDRKDIEADYKDQFAAQGKRADALRENFTLTQKWAEAVGNVMEAQASLDAAEKSGSYKDQSLARTALAKAQAEAEKPRSEMVKRFRGSLHDRLAAEKADRADARKNTDAERKFEQHERDRNDRAVRAGRMTNAERAKLNRDLRLDGKPLKNQDIPGDTLKAIQTINATLAKFGQNIGVV